MGKKKNVFLTEWRAKNKDLIKKSYPEYSDEQIEAYLDRKIDENLVNPKGQLVNNYVNKIINVNLLDLIDWMENVQPIIAGNGTFFKNQNQSYSPSNNMLDEFLINRNKYKGMLKIVEKTSYDYDTYDRLQKTEKISANSYYGGSGNEAFVFYNLYAAIAVTSTAQSLISTTETAFESFLANNTPYLNYDDCINFIQNVLNDKTNLKSNFLDNIPVEKLLNRLLDNFREEPSTIIEKNLEAYLRELNQDQINRLYYKNNIYEFSNLKKINSMILSIVKDTDQFKNPNKIPENIKERLEVLWSYYEEFVFYNHFIFNRIQRLKYEKRKAVVVVDTDSNMIHLGPWVEFMQTNIYERYNIDKPEENKLYISINIMNYFVTNMVNTILISYTKKSNVLKEYRHRINMKNEFLYLRMILSKVKKRYIGSIRLREGEEFIPEKLDIKG